MAAVSPFALNEAGDVVGFVTCSLVQRAFRWTADTGLELIPMPAGTTESRGLAINGSKVVGTYDNPVLELGKTGFLYDFETDEFTSLGTLPGGNWSEAHAVNPAAEVVGFWGNIVKGPSPLAFIWSDGEMIDINGDFGTINTEANGINTAGLVTGWMGSSILFDARAFIWDDGKVTELPLVPNGVTAKGQAINEQGHVAGEGRVFLDDGKAMAVQSFLWADNQITDLGTLRDTTFTRARDIDCQNGIVGYCHNQFLTDQAAFIWQDGVITALNDLIPFDPNLNLERAMGINQAGQIAVAARSDDLDASVGVLLSPIKKGIPGDLDNDGQVGVKDLLILLGNWGPCDNCENCPADLNGDCVVGVDDLLILLGNWG
ncbi:MAG: hypothetical protein V3W34_09820 [Phycisphaerae bacterium]